MAVPKKRTGHSAQGSRRSNWKATKPETTKCPNCGATVQKGAKFCSECGTKMPVSKFCSACGAKLGDNAKFCSECGHKAE